MKRARLVAVLVTLALLGGVSVPVYTAYRAGHQQWLNQELLKAIKHEDAAAALAALNAGADPNSREVPPDNRTILQRVRDMVLHHNPPVENPDDYYPALGLVFKEMIDRDEMEEAGSGRHESTLAFAETTSHALLEHGANPNLKARLEQPALHQVCGVGDERCLRDLVNHGANVNVLDENGQNALSHTYDNPRLTEFLLAHGANPNQVDQFEDTPLIYADTAAVMQVLLRHGAKPDLGRFHALTKLMLSANKLDADAVALLLHYGANPYERDDYGQNAFDYFDEGRRSVPENGSSDDWPPDKIARVHAILEAYRKAHPEKRKHQRNAINNPLPAP